MARGRKRKAGRRLPCGKRPREETQREAMSTVLDARRRHYGVSASQAKDERLGTALGRLSFAGRISAEQCKARYKNGPFPGLKRGQSLQTKSLDRGRGVIGVGEAAVA